MRREDADIAPSGSAADIAPAGSAADIVPAGPAADIAPAGSARSFAASIRSAPRFLKFRWRRWRLARRYLRGTGLEVGALHAPLSMPRGARVRYVDRMSAEQLRSEYPELAGERLVEVDVVDDGETLDSQPDASADFVVANHFIEHTQDPIRTLASHLRMLRPRGVLYMAVPDRRLTFDSGREPTPLEHLLDDHRDGPARSRRAHFEEWARLVERVPEQTVASRAELLDEKDYSIHFHVWTPDEFVALLEHARRELQLPFILEELRENEHEFIVILRRAELHPDAGAA